MPSARCLGTTILAAAGYRLLKNEAVRRRSDLGSGPSLGRAWQLQVPPET